MTNGILQDFIDQQTPEDQELLTRYQDRIEDQKSTYKCIDVARDGTRLQEITALMSIYSMANRRDEDLTSRIMALAKEIMRTL